MKVSFITYRSTATCSSMTGIQSINKISTSQGASRPTAQTHFLLISANEQTFMIWKTALKRKPKGPLLGCKRKKIVLCQNIEIWNGWKTGLSKAEGVSCSEEKESSTQCWWEEESGNTFVVVPSSVNRKEKKNT